MYRYFKGNEPKTLLAFCHNTGYSVKVARKLLDAARIMRNRFQPRLLDEEDDEWELADDLLVDDWDYVSMLYDGMEAEQVDRAFRKLNYRDQTLLEQRNAICMHCGRVSPPGKKASFEDLATLFEGCGTSGA